MSQASHPTLRALVVGTGFGCRIQVPALRGAGFEVAALVGADPARTAERAAANGVPAAFTDLETAIRATGADAVAISTPPHTHADLAIAALELGCHVICEKPFARNGDEARAMLEVARKAGKVHALGNEFRFVPARAAVGRALAEGRIGEPSFATFLQLMSFVVDFEQDFPDWWFDPAQGGGWLGASGSHLVDQARSWLGEFESVSASLSNVSLGRGAVEDSFAVRFRTTRGLEGVLQQSSGSRGPFVDLARVSGPLGSVWIEGPTAHVADAAGTHELPIPPDLALAPAPALGGDERQNRLDWKLMAETEIAPYTQLCRAFRAAILGEPSPSPVPLATFADGVANMQVLDAIRASARAGGAMVRVGEV
jgi:predicted dehydrogenase